MPKGLYAPLEDNPDEVDFAEEFKMPDFAEQANLENWVHFNPYILKQGRATYFVDPKIPEDQKEEYLAKLGEADPKIERLKAINEDKGILLAIQDCRSLDWKAVGALEPTEAHNFSTMWGRKKGPPVAMQCLLSETRIGLAGSLFPPPRNSPQSTSVTASRPPSCPSTQ